MKLSIQFQSMLAAAVPVPVQPASVTKCVDWSYPTSDNAKRFGFYATGCYTVSLHRRMGDKFSVRAESGHATRAEALAVARRLPFEWSAAFKQFHPEEAAL